ncbi:MAG: hypothetical protein PHQ24_09325 [Proteiniphilum sp.]|nr:hypothetical protein [Proteiniphilum sp.]
MDDDLTYGSPGRALQFPGAHPPVRLFLGVVVDRVRVTALGHPLLSEYDERPISPAGGADEPLYVAREPPPFDRDPVVETHLRDREGSGITRLRLDILR